ncbi:MAG: hypothetical protein WC997_06450 [Porticoccaceae bacterium]
MKYLQSSLAVLLLAITTGCAVGNKYDYSSVSVSLPLQGSGELGVAVVENRAYVVSGDKAPDFIGIQRGGFGNPFNVTTKSGKPLTEDMAASLGAALERSGFKVSALDVRSPDASVIAAAATRQGQQRNVILKVNEWKTDVMMRIRLIYDLDLQITDGAGRTIASNRLQGDEVIGGGGFEGQNAGSASSSFEAKIGRLFNKPEIFAALGE